MHRVVASFRDAILHVPLSNGCTRCMTMIPDRMRVYRRCEACGDGLFSRIGKNLITGFVYSKVAREKVLQLVAFGEGLLKKLGCFRLVRLQHIGMLLCVGIESQISYS